MDSLWILYQLIVFCECSIRRFILLRFLVNIMGNVFQFCMHTWGVTCICRDMGMCHYFGYFFGVAPGFLGSFLGYSRIFGYHFFGYSRIFGYHFLVKFDFFRNNSDFGVLILILRSMTLWNVACRALVSMISTVLASVLLCLCKESHVVYQFEFIYL